MAGALRVQLEGGLLKQNGCGEQSDVHCCKTCICKLMWRQTAQQIVKMIMTPSKTKYATSQNAQK
jgi:hypothetical protein